MDILRGWANFFVIVGSSAGALIGLQFVVMTLIADAPNTRGRSQEAAGNAFATPTIVHFGAVLLLAAMMSAPWRTAAPAAIAWGVLGAAGLVYQMIVTRRMTRQNAYRPEFEDWLFHAVLPFFSYAALLGSAFFAFHSLEDAMYFMAAASLMLLFVGIHNAWDAVTYHVFVKSLRS